ncbi:hypothetical protein DPMN_167305 [Dreissena polymorpha]|uniref:Uncharacterized protein n=1 Tax=Dreissena polymorpha TaxID=45954 RepID=A0A9D4F0L9_DREPO|nr:hypothetical protein DPMN_167305 [Dreissena polymorpha]
MAGMEVQNVFYTLPEEEGANVYARAVDALGKHFAPQANYERHMFRKLDQSPTESVDQYITVATEIRDV